MVRKVSALICRPITSVVCIQMILEFEEDLVRQKCKDGSYRRGLWKETDMKIETQRDKLNSVRPRQRATVLNR